MNKFLTIALPTIMLIFSMISCTKESAEKKDEWVEIDSVMPNLELSHKLDSIFAKSEQKRDCLHINYSRVAHIVNSLEEYKEIDTCNIIPDIDFNKFTLTVGGFHVHSFSNMLSDIKLFSNAAQEVLLFNFSVDTCEMCFVGDGYNYFWRLYPKHNSEYQMEVTIKNVK